MSIHIQGKRWFQRSYGVTYNSVTIHINGDTHYLPMEYGYGDYYLQRAIEWLVANGKLPEAANHMALSELTHTHNITYGVSDVARKKDL